MPANLTIRFLYSGACANSTVTVAFPTGIEYAGNVKRSSTTANFTVAARDVSNPRKPQFTIGNVTGGCLDTLRVYVVYPNKEFVNTNANKLTVAGTDFTPLRTSTNGDTLFYKIFGATLFGSDNLLCNGESVSISEPVKVAICSTTTTYGASWGANCVTTTATSSITPASGTAKYPNPVVAQSNYVGRCTVF